MKSRTMLTAVSCLALPLAAGIAYAASLTNADKQFMIMAANTDMTEAHEGQMAEDRGASEDLKTFGKTLVQDHTQAYWELKQLAATTGVTIPTGINTARNPEINSLLHLKGAAFDRQFARDEITDHRQALAAFEREAKQGHDAAVKDYAAKMIPVLQKHLHLAEECAKPARKG